MSIKGTTKELYIAKSKVNIVDFWANKRTYMYNDLKRIDYCFAGKLHTGYMSFITKDDKKEVFNFRFASNEPMTRTVAFIKEHCPELELVERDKSDEKTVRMVTVTSVYGHKEIGLSSPWVNIFQRPDGSTYFNKDDTIYYDIIDYEWAGPQYDLVTKSSGTDVSKSIEKTKGKALKIGAGALAGTLLSGGASAVPTLVGAAMGAGSKGRKNTNGVVKKNMVETSTQVEKKGIATLAFRRQDTDMVYKLSFYCDTTLDAKIRCFNIDNDVEPEPPQTVINITSDNHTKPKTLNAIDEIKGLKELLDMGAITEDEYNAKKKQILGL